MYIHTESCPKAYAKNPWHIADGQYWLTKTHPGPCADVSQGLCADAEAQASSLLCMTEDLGLIVSGQVSPGLAASPFHGSPGTLGITLGPFEFPDTWASDSGLFSKINIL